MINVNKNASYYAHSRPEMLKYIPKNAKRILEIGCGAGNFAELVKNETKAESWGIENNEISANKAKRIINNVFCGDIIVILDKIPNNYFDCIVFNDVLEHLADPYSLLASTKNKLTVNGQIVASIPNVLYVSVLYNILIKKNWRYTDCGVLDSTHLRFFTKKSIIEMFNDLDFEVELIEGINPYTGTIFKLLNLITFGLFNDSKYLQFACIAKIKEAH